MKIKKGFLIVGKYRFFIKQTGYLFMGGAHRSILVTDWFGFYKEMTPGWILPWCLLRTI